MEYYTCFLYHMETAPGRAQVEENLPNQSTVNKVPLCTPAENLKNKNQKTTHCYPSPQQNPPKTL